MQVVTNTCEAWAQVLAIQAGVKKYGGSKWASILKDPEYSIILKARSQGDLSDKWRGMTVGKTGKRSAAGKAKEDVPAGAPAEITDACAAAAPVEQIKAEVGENCVENVKSLKEPPLVEEADIKEVQELKPDEPPEKKMKS